MSTGTITVSVNRLRRALGDAVSWSAHGSAATTGPGDLDLPLALTAGLPVTPRAPEVSSSPRTRRPAGRRRAAAAVAR